MKAVQAKRRDGLSVKARRKQSERLPSDIHADHDEEHSAAEDSVAEVAEGSLDALARHAFNADDAQGDDGDVKAVAPVRITNVAKVLFVLAACIGAFFLGSSALRSIQLHSAEGHTSMLAAASAPAPAPSLAGANHSLNATGTLLQPPAALPSSALPPSPPEAGTPPRPTQTSLPPSSRLASPPSSTSPVSPPSLHLPQPGPTQASLPPSPRLASPPSSTSPVSPPSLHLPQPPPSPPQLPHPISTLVDIRRVRASLSSTLERYAASLCMDDDQPIFAIPRNESLTLGSPLRSLRTPSSHLGEAPSPTCGSSTAVHIRSGWRPLKCGWGTNRVRTPPRLGAVPLWWRPR